ncbi:MAG: LytTR family transcriptional regulator DNA-binding domain-containing protein [Bacteroidia bacterium]|jgi:two-component system LytT family response regulator|nr:LytTR family transcriptional regulator DNA-binding domain-containing protein [Bacteroidia bacterium]
MIKALLIDDEPLARSIVREYLQNYPDIEIVQECNDGFEGVKAIQQHQPELIFLDIQMPKINGFEMLELVEEHPSVIFTTAFDEYALKAFETHAIDYLLKPFSKDRFDKAIQKWREQYSSENAKKKTDALLENTSQQPEQSQRVVVKTGSKIRIIPVHDILYFEADDDYIRIHTADGSFLKKKTMQYFEQTLNSSQFVRVHRSYIIQVAYLTRIDQENGEHHTAILKNGAKVPLSRTGYPKLKEVLGM